MKPPGHRHILVLGAQKGGTTTLHAHLQAVPSIVLPACKEIHYFSLHADRPAAWYWEHFSGAQSDQLCADITPYYLFHPAAPERIRALLPEARLVVLLRDPVERALSQYFHACRLGFETLPLPEALEQEPTRLAGAERILARPGAQHFSHQKHSYVSRSCYGPQLQRYLELFPAEQLLVLRSEDLFAGSAQFWRRLEHFLGVELAPAAAMAQRVNAGRGEAQAVEPQVRSRLEELLAPTRVAMARDYGIHWP